MAAAPSEPPARRKTSLPGEAALAQPGPPPCPFCGSTRTEVMSLFGSHASLTTCWCPACRSPFEFLRWRGEAKEGPREHGPG